MTGSLATMAMIACLVMLVTISSMVTTAMIFLNGGNGNDKIYAGNGADRLVGGLGTDHLYAGNDGVRDTLVFNSINDSKVGSAVRDKVYAFDSGEDVLDLSSIDANLSTSGNNAFAFTGTVAAANSVWYTVSGISTLVRADNNGDGVADFEIDLVNSGAINGSDIIL